MNQETYFEKVTSSHSLVLVIPSWLFRKGAGRSKRRGCHSGH